MSERPPASFLLLHLDLLREAGRSGPVADLACGRGRNAIATAEHGIPTLALDRSRELLRELGPDGETLRGSRFAYGRGCGECHHTGYRGRTGIFEIMRLNDAIRAAISKGSSTTEVREEAMRAGMISLRESGLRAVTDRRTTVEEVLRETMA